MARDDNSFENKDNFGAFDDYMVDYDEDESNGDDKSKIVETNSYEDSESELRDETSRMLESQISMDFDSQKKEDNNINFDTAAYNNQENDNDNNENKPKKSNYNEELKNKLIRYAIWIFVGLVVFLILLAIITSFTSKKSKKEKIEKNLTLSSGEKYSFANGVGDYKWESSVNEVATVNKTGEIEALKNGDTIITITTDKEIITYKVHVNKVDESVTVTKVTMTENTIELNVKESYDMVVNVYPKNATSSDLSWFSSDESVAVVDNNGKITAVGKGSCTITVKSSNGNYDICLVKVIGKGGDGIVGEIETITFDTSSLVLKSGIKYTVSYVISPSDARGNLEWISSNEKIATVEDGVITTKKEGTISIVAKNGNVQQSLTLTVVEGDENTPDVISDGKTVSAESISLNQTDVSLYKGNKYSLSVLFSPTNTTDKRVTWTSSNSKVASVDENGNVTALSLGEATIMATTSNNKTAFCQVSVINESSVEPTKETISLNLSNLSINIGEEAQLIETVTPSSSISKVTWSSSDSNVAKVSSNGVVKGISSGTAKITASLSNGEKAECNVTVSQKVINAIMINLNSSRIDLRVGGTSQLRATVLPKNATNKTITWSSSDSRVATVDNNGKVTGKGSGIATITARTSNGIKAHCTVVVKSDSKSSDSAINGTASLFNDLTDTEIVKALSNTYDSSLRVGDREYNVFKQRNFRDYTFWYDGNIADNGSAPMALSIILSGYRNINPVSVANYMGYASIDRIAETADYYGLSISGIIKYNSLTSDNDIFDEVSTTVRNHLSNGFPILAYVSGSSNPSCVKYKYSGNNHYIAILGLDDNEELVVGNPGLLDGKGIIDELLNCYMPGDDKMLILLIPNK